ncbi:MAG: hypothetical protein OES69_02390 [Myxococcales bacterium]|nr:hypothetical protein [Myxococcales bacterium]
MSAFFVDGLHLPWDLLEDYPAFLDTVTLGVYVRLLLSAQHKDTYLYWRGNSHQVRRGEVLLSVRKGTKAAGISKAKLCRALERLQAMGLISKVAFGGGNKAGTKIRVLRFDQHFVVAHNPPEGATIQ